MNKLSRILLAGSTFVGMALASAFAINPPAHAEDGPQLFPTFPPIHVVSIKATTDASSNTRVGDTFNYVLELRNDTEQDATVSVTDTLPTEVELVISPTLEFTSANSVVATPTVSGNIVNWSGSLPKAKSAKLRIRVKLVSCSSEDVHGSGIGNSAEMRIENSGLSVSSVSFRPSACKDAEPTPGPTPTPGPEPTPSPTNTLPADVAVVKFGRLHLDWARPERGWQASWYVGYQNRSERTANDVVINDNPSSNQSLISLRSWPNISPTTTSAGLQFNIGSLSRGRGGSIWLRTSVPATTTASTVLTNSVSISASNDSRLDNNSALVTITLPALPPSITYPRSGATCTETITVTGKAQANAALQVYVDGAPVMTTTANSAGNWEASLKLDEGINVLYVRNIKSNNEPEHDGDNGQDGSGGWGDYRQSNVIFLKVDTALKWDPISLNFTDPNGEKKYARHWLGWFEEIGWYVGVQPSTTYTVGVRICCQDLTATVTLTVPSSTVTPTVVELTDPDGDRVYTGAWTTGSAKELVSGKLTLCVRGDGVLRCARGRAYPIWPKANRTVFITESGFDVAKLTVVPGEIVEFVNMDVKSRAFSSSANLAAQANGSEALSADDDAVRLEVGESYSVQVPNTQITYYDSQNSTESITLAPSGNAVFLPMVLR
jgi:uncharacterized repeat protein (TIGR01451 family)